MFVFLILLFVGIYFLYIITQITFTFAKTYFLRRYILKVFRKNNKEAFILYKNNKIINNEIEHLIKEYIKGFTVIDISLINNNEDKIEYFIYKYIKEYRTKFPALVFISNKHIEIIKLYNIYKYKKNRQKNIRKLVNKIKILVK
ncbi:MAG: hypothetical protein LBV17_03745 [Treponema sp.]|nr:hypothetical protein [Treponema sp.]